MNVRIIWRLNYDSATTFRLPHQSGNDGRQYHKGKWAHSSLYFSLSLPTTPQSTAICSLKAARRSGSLTFIGEG